MSELFNKNGEEQKSTLVNNEQKKSTLFKGEVSSEDTQSGIVTAKKSNAKTVVVFSVLGVFLAALIVALALLLIFKPDEGTQEPPFDVWEGEGAYGLAAHLVYPLVEEDTVTKMDIYRDGEKYSFIKAWDENLGKYDWRVEGLEAIDLNATSFEMLRMWLCTVTTKDPIRNVKESELEDYGVDKANENGFTVYYTENGVEKSHTMRIGEQTSLSNGVYYAYYEGRNHIYKISNYCNVSIFMVYF